MTTITVAEVYAKYAANPAFPTYHPIPFGVRYSFCADCPTIAGVEYGSDLQHKLHFLDGMIEVVTPDTLLEVVEAAVTPPQSHECEYCHDYLAPVMVDGVWMCPKCFNTGKAYLGVPIIAPPTPPAPDSGPAEITHIRIRVADMIRAGWGQGDMEILLAHLDTANATIAALTASLTHRDLELADVNHRLSTFINDAYGLVYPEDPTGWEYPGQAWRHIRDRIEAQAKTIAALIEQGEADDAINATLRAQLAAANAELDTLRSPQDNER